LLARHCYGDTYDQLGGNALGLVLREPIGVVGMITLELSAPYHQPKIAVCAGSRMLRGYQTERAYVGNDPSSGSDIT